MEEFMNSYFFRLDEDRWVEEEYLRELEEAELMLINDENLKRMVEA